MNSKTWRYWLAGLVALLALAGVVTGVRLSRPLARPMGRHRAAKLLLPLRTILTACNPLASRGCLIPTLVNSGKVHRFVVAPPAGSAPSASNPIAPLLNIVWGADHLTGASAGEPAAGINQTLPLNALISGNFSLDHTTDGAPPGPPSSRPTRITPVT